MVFQRKNQDIRNMIKDAPFYSYNVAEKLGISDNYLTYLLRHELTKEQKSSILDAINSLKSEAKSKAGV